MGGLFSNDGTGWVHDCATPWLPTATWPWTCPECGDTWCVDKRGNPPGWVRGEVVE